jgi:2,3-dihydroxybiphenyl 1,2-dioxygenase
MSVAGLGYVGVDSAKRDEWTDFGRGVLGMQVATEADGEFLHLRMDDRFSRFLIRPAAREGLGFIGWEVADAAGLDDARAALEKAEAGVRDGTREEAAERRVEALIVSSDPAGNSLEFFYGQRRADRPFQPGRDMSGFKTGELGMGHLVMEVPDPKAVCDFYTEHLGFRMTDRLQELLYFLRTNPRHHSIGIAHIGGDPRLLHVMLEVTTLADVGTAFDAALERRLPMSTIGVHANDNMTSFYVQTPSGFEIEYGFNGLEVDDATWETTSTDRPSLWGHHQLDMSAPPGPRAFRRRQEEQEGQSGGR